MINFDNVWKWLGFTRKDSAKKLLEKFFTKDIDYKVTLLRSEEPKNEDNNQVKTIFRQQAENKIKEEKNIIKKTRKKFWKKEKNIIKKITRQK